MSPYITAGIIVETKDLYRSHSAAPHPITKALISHGKRTLPCIVHALDKECLCVTAVTAVDLHVLNSTVIKSLKCFTVSLVKAKHPDSLLPINLNQDVSCLWCSFCTNVGQYNNT